MHVAAALMLILNQEMGRPESGLRGLQGRKQHQVLKEKESLGQTQEARCKPSNLELRYPDCRNKLKTKQTIITIVTSGCSINDLIRPLFKKKMLRSYSAYWPYVVCESLNSPLPLKSNTSRRAASNAIHFNSLSNYQQFSSLADLVKINHPILVDKEMQLFPLSLYPLLLAIPILTFPFLCSRHALYMLPSMFFIHSSLQKYCIHTVHLLLNKI